MVAPSADAAARVPGPAVRRPAGLATPVVAAAGLAAAVTAFAWSPAGVESGPVVCPFRLLTGLPCPGCGLTRSWVYAAHGRWGDSVAANPFGLVAAALVLALVVVVARAWWRRAPVPDLDDLARRPWVLGLVGVWVAYAVVRLVGVAVLGWSV